MKETIVKTNKIKAGSFFEKINEIDKPLAKLIKKKKELEMKKEKLHKTMKKYKES